MGAAAADAAPALRRCGDIRFAWALYLIGQSVRVESCLTSNGDKDFVSDRSGSIQSGCMTFDTLGSALLYAFA